MFAADGSLRVVTKNRRQGRPLAAWTFYRAWRDGVKDDPTGEKTSLRVTGATVEDAQPRWRRWAEH